MAKQNVEVQIAKLYELMSVEEIKQAEQLAQTQGNVVRLAFRLMSRRIQSDDGLTNRQRKEYEKMKDIDPQQAEKWKELTAAINSKMKQQ